MTPVRLHAIRSARPMKSPCAIGSFLSVGIRRSLIYTYIRDSRARHKRQTSGRSATDVNGGSIRTDLERRKPRLGRCTHSHQIKPDLHSVNNESPRGCPLGCNNGHTVVYRTVSPPLVSFGFPSFGRREREEKNRIDENEAKFHTEGRQRLGRGAKSRRRLEKSHGDMAEVKETDW